MPSERDKAKRWRPRWSVRMLLIVVTLVCAYLACWKVAAAESFKVPIVREALFCIGSSN